MFYGIFVSGAKMKISVPALFFVIAQMFFSGCTKQQHGLTLEQGILSVGVEIGYPPMEYYDTDGRTLIGFDIELTTALADRLGLQVKYIDTAWEGMLSGLDTGKYDIAINVTVLPVRQKRYNFTKPYIGNSMAIILLKEAPLKINEPEDIAGYRIAFQGDTTAQYFAEKLSGSGLQFSSFAYDKITNCFDDLLLQRVDAVIADSLVAYNYTTVKNSRFTIGWQGPADEIIAMCLKKGNDALTAALDNAIDELFADGTIPGISQKIFGQDAVSSVRK